MSFEVAQASNCGIGAAVFGAGGTPLPAYVTGLDPANCLKTLDVPARAVVFGRITGSLEAQVDVLAFGYDENKNHLYVGPGHVIGALAANSIIGGNANSVNAPRSPLLGGDGNTNNCIDGFLGSGSSNQLTSTNEAVLVGGRLNVVAGQLAFLGAGENNQVSATAAAVVAGGTCIIGPLAQHSFIGAGHVNSVTGEFAAIVGGRRNVASGQDSIVCGGGNGAGVPNNQASGIASGIVAGQFNLNAAASGFVGAGNQNGINANAPNSVVGGGQNNQVSSTTGLGLSVIAGGLNNAVTRHRGFIGAGQLNQCHGGSAFIGAGTSNIINFVATSSGNEAIAGGQSNSITNAAVSFIGGGLSNQVNGNTSVIGGGRINIVGCIASGIFSGEDNQTIAGTTNSAINGNNFIGGGSGHRVTGIENVIAGGDDNAISNNTQGVIGGGQGNRVISTAGSQTLDGNTIAGGQSNVIDLTVGVTPSGYAAIGGGIGNQVTAEIASIPGGQGLRAQGYNQHVKGYFNVAQGTSPAFTQNDHLEILGNGTAGVRRNAYAWQHDATLVWFANAQVPVAATNAAAIVALTAVKPVATHLGAQTMVVVAGLASWFVCDGAVWKFAF